MSAAKGLGRSRYVDTSKKSKLDPMTSLCDSYRRQHHVINVHALVVKDGLVCCFMFWFTVNLPVAGVGHARTVVETQLQLSARYWR